MAVTPNLPRLPSLPHPTDPRFLEAVKQTLEQLKVTTTAAVNAAAKANAAVDAAAQGAKGGVAGAANTGLPTMQTPPAPTGFTAHGAFSVVVLSWTRPPFANYAYTEVRRATSNNLGAAVTIGLSPATMYTDTVGGSQTYYYWVRHVATSGRAGVWSQSAQASTPDNPEWMLQQLTGQITSSPLWQQFQSDLGVTDLQQQWTVKVAATLDGQTVVGGIGLAGDDGTGTIDMGILANRLWVAAPGVDYSDPSKRVIPFIIDSGKVYIDTAMIRDATITAAQMGSAFIENLVAVQGKIQTANIDYASIWDLVIGNYIKSDDYDAGVTGWSIGKNGDADFRNLNVRGLIYNGTLDSSGGISGLDNYIDFREGSGTKGDFVLGDTDTGNYVSFKYETAYHKKILRIRGDIALRNYEPGNILLHNNNLVSTVPLRYASGQAGYGVAGIPLYTKHVDASIPLNPFFDEGLWLQLAHSFSAGTTYFIKGTAITREGIVRANIRCYQQVVGYYGGSKFYTEFPVFHLCVKKAQTGLITRVKSYFAPTSFDAPGRAAIQVSGDQATYGSGRSSFIYVNGDNIHHPSASAVDGSFTDAVDVSVEPDDIIGIYADFPTLYVTGGAARHTQYAANYIQGYSGPILPGNPTNTSAMADSIVLSIGFYPEEVSIK